MRRTRRTAQAGWVALVALAACSRTAPTAPAQDHAFRRCDGPTLAAEREVELALVRDPETALAADALRIDVERACGLLGLRCSVTLDERPLGTPLAVSVAALPHEDAALRAAVYDRIGACVRAAYPTMPTAAPRKPSIAVLVLPTLAPADAALAAVLPELDGLGLPADHPALRTLPEPLRRPLVLLDGARSARLDDTRRTALLGHELGHALGLGHAGPDRPTALMGPAGACAGGLDDAEVGIIRQTLDAQRGR